MTMQRGVRPGECGLQGCRCEYCWTGYCSDQQACDRRCDLHGQCRNGTCVSFQGQTYRHCTIRKYWRLVHLTCMGPHWNNFLSHKLVRKSLGTRTVRWRWTSLQTVRWPEILSTGQLADRTICQQDTLPTGQFVERRVRRTFRRQDNSLTGQFTDRTLFQTWQFADRINWLQDILTTWKFAGTTNLSRIEIWILSCFFQGFRMSYPVMRLLRVQSDVIRADFLRYWGYFSHIELSWIPPNHLLFKQVT